MNTRLLRSIASGLAIVAGAALATLGAFYGYASAEHYGWVLRLWFKYSIFGALFLMLALALGPRWARFASIALLLLFGLAWIDPLYRFVIVERMRVPTRAEVAALESGLKLPSGAAPLQSYARYYWIVRSGQTEPVQLCESEPTTVKKDADPVIRGEFIEGSAAKPSVYLTGDPPIMCDGGCSVLEFSYDAKARKVISIECQGEA